MCMAAWTNFLLVLKVKSFVVCHVCLICFYLWFLSTALSCVKVALLIKCIENKKKALESHLLSIWLDTDPCVTGGDPVLLKR